MKNKRLCVGRIQYSMCALLALSTLLASVIGIGTCRMQESRRQRVAVEKLWELGALTSRAHDSHFTAPANLEMLHNTWFDDVVGYEAPVAVLFPEQASSNEFHGDSEHYLAEVGRAISQLPSVETVFLEDSDISSDDYQTLRSLIPKQVIIVVGRER